MSGLERVLHEIKSRRNALHSQNVVIDISREEVVYRICQEIVEQVIRDARSPTNGSER